MFDHHDSKICYLECGFAIKTNTSNIIELDSVLVLYVSICILHRPFVICMSKQNVHTSHLNIFVTMISISNSLFKMHCDIYCLKKGPYSPALP